MSILGTIWSAAALPALGNDRRTRKQRSALAAKQRHDARLLCLAELSASQALPLRAALSRRDGFVVTFWRLRPDGRHAMDDDGLRATFKHIRDGVADWLGVDDSPRSGITWSYTDIVYRELPGSLALNGVPSKAKWVVTFGTRPLSQMVAVNRTDELLATVSQPDEQTLRSANNPELTTLDRMKVIRDGVILLVDNGSAAELRVEVSIVPNFSPNGVLVRVVLR